MAAFPIVFLLFFLLKWPLFPIGNCTENAPENTLISIETRSKDDKHLNTERSMHFQLTLLGLVTT